MISVHIDSRRALAGVEGTLGEVSAWICLAAIDHLRLRIGAMHGVDKGAQKLSKLLRIAIGIPVPDVLFVPQSPVVDAIVKMVHHPCRVSIEGRDLLRRGRRIED